MNGISSRPIPFRKSKNRSASTSTWPRRRFFFASEVAVMGEVVVPVLDRQSQAKSTA